MRNARFFLLLLCCIFITACDDASTTEQARDEAAGAVQPAATESEKPVHDYKLPFLVDYSGQTIDELVALEGVYRIDSLPLAVEQALYKKLGYTPGLALLTEAELTVLAVESLEREVNNGGYHQFFVNTPEYAPHIVDALRRINCNAAADITRRAIDTLDLPALNVDEIENIIYDDDDARDAALDALDQEFYEYPDPISERLFEYIKANKDEIRI